MRYGRGIGVLVSVMALVVPARAASPAWPTRSHDARRTGQSEVPGPGSAAPLAAYVATGGSAINISPTVAPGGAVYFGSWGIIRTNGSTDPRTWDKFDGKVYGLTLDAGVLSDLWTPVEPAATPYCWDAPGRTSPVQCPTGGDWNYLNGTVEGAAAIGPDGTLYFGRGDGKAYAVDPATGSVLRSFATFDPAHPTDPEGGGQVIAAPLLAPDGRLYVATWGDPNRPNQTNAVYALDPATMTMIWRYPASGSFGVQPVMAAPALSPDGTTLYVAQWTGGDGSTAPRVLALRLDVPDGSSDAARLAWAIDSVSQDGAARPLSVASLAVGSDGTIYAGAADTSFSPPRAVVYALHDDGTSASFAWGGALAEVSRKLNPFQIAVIAAFALALREEHGATTVLYAGSIHQDAISGFMARDGRLKAIDPATGTILWSYDPDVDGGTPGSITGLAVGADGIVYAGASGIVGGAGAILAVNPDGTHRFKAAMSQYTRWAIPAIGPTGAVFVGAADKNGSCYDDGRTGACTAIDPQLYALSSAAAPRPAEAAHLRLDKGAGGLAMTWDAVAEDGSGAPIGVAGYDVIRSGDPRFPAGPGTSRIGTPAVNAFTAPGDDLTDGADHYYLVIARTAEGIAGP